MSYKINDQQLIDALCDFKNNIEEAKAGLPYAGSREIEFQHPLDDSVIGENGLLKKLLSNKTSIGYAAAEDLDKLWKTLIEKAIMCLRFFDEREPFMQKKETNIVAYGLEKLVDYHHRYTGFERLMYGANDRYRDHVFHAIRVWLLGVFCLIERMPEDGDGDKAEPFISRIRLDGGAEMVGEFNFFEKISMWTIIALCHDLGYPLERAEQILTKTKEMMKAFVPNANIWNDFGYSGVQDNINDYILKFISTKMVRCPGSEEEYIGRIQPKYFLKYAKSLEQCQHGIISTIIIFKLLVYFMESDFNLNDDYTFEQEDARQFYIRREILRSIAAHTCPDAYNTNITTFSSFLFLIDELQEWGRKSWNELYTGSDKLGSGLTLEWFTEEGIKYGETIDLKVGQKTDGIKAAVDSIVSAFQKQYSRYKSTFRDGQGALEKQFGIVKEIRYLLPDGQHGKEREVQVRFTLPSTGKSEFVVGPLKLAKSDIPEFRKTIKQRTDGLLYSEDIKFIQDTTGA